MDLLLVASAVALIVWAFGPVAGALAALIVGFGYPWEFAWTAGSLGRFVWLAALVAGIACLKKQRFLIGGALVALSGMLLARGRLVTEPLLLICALVVLYQVALVGALQYQPRHMNGVFVFLVPFFLLAIESAADRTAALASRLRQRAA